jgi:hypothetical protein
MRIPLPALLLGFLAAFPAAAAQAPRHPPIDSLVLRAHTWFLSHDLLEGRGTASRGADLAALYLAAAAERLGLQGAGTGGGYFQEVPLVEAAIDASWQRIEIAETDSAGRQLRSAALRPELFLYNTGTASTLVPFEGRLVFVGSAPDILAGSASLPPLRDRIALVRGMFGSAAAAADTLRGRGARGVVHLIGSPELFRLYVQSRGTSRLFIAPEANAVSSFVPDIPAVIVDPRLEPLLLAGAEGNEGDPPFTVNRRASFGIMWSPRPVRSHNVLALIRGSSRSLRDEYVVLTAHYDHLGISTPDASGDSIYNGFSDNAAGSAMLLAIARALRAGPLPRSVLFIWFTGEERGLLGSDYFVANPTVPLARIAGVINLDAGAPPAPNVSWRIAGGPQSTLGDMAVAVARAAGWEATTSPATPNTDYYPFLRSGVPAVFLVPGPGAFEGMTSEQSNELRRRWDRYHQAGDHWSPDYPFSGLVRYADFALRLATELGWAPRPRMR